MKKQTVSTSPTKKNGENTRRFLDGHKFQRNEWLNANPNHSPVANTVDEQRAARELAFLFE